MKKERKEGCYEEEDIRRLFIDLTSVYKTGKEFDEGLKRLQERIDEMLEKQKGEKI